MDSSLNTIIYDMLLPIMNPDTGKKLLKIYREKHLIIAAFFGQPSYNATGSSFNSFD